MRETRGMQHVLCVTKFVLFVFFVCLFFLFLFFFFDSDFISITQVIHRAACGKRRPPNMLNNFYLIINIETIAASLLKTLQLFGHW